MTLDEVVAATLEIESYVSSPDCAGIIAVEVEDETAAVAAVSPIDKLTRTLEHLAERVETLQSEVARARRPRDHAEMTHVKRDAPQGRGRGRFLGECWTCHVKELPTEFGAAGKLATSGTRNQVPEVDQSAFTDRLFYLLFPSQSHKWLYRLPGKINGTQVSLLLDVGAAVTLRILDSNNG